MGLVRVTVIAGVLGVAAVPVVLGLSWLLNLPFTGLQFVLCPACVGVMGLDPSGNWPGDAILLLVMGIVNAAVYMLIAVLGFQLLEWLRSRH